MKTKWIILILFIAAGTGLHTFIFSEIPIWKVPKLMSSMRAKEFCTCRFILNNPKEFCLERVKKGYPLFEWEVREEARQAIFSNYLSESIAQVEPRTRYGCALIK